ncbi:dehydrogenase [Asanoa ishikariensis]|uniref:NADP-dependent 3-hydroxy acid dehydrogenase YdfG n=1 Tax=Asanoa ishikariensis TaxID=137265 RepID=A0A1H3TXN9_9ACTN|nr:SDR family oxidoreductase [Asanoa ishikariensis]GIF67667.1 dehydrogenase [Asanoa ishikariensis]SDZ54986.1 NADP-dependent 3-hydroxy acid dehydrogenase YdfG [Asanoa ishikariensis]
MELAGKVVVITGAAGGIGSALARRFADEGVAGMVLADLDADAAEALATSINRGLTRAVGCDVTDPAQVAALVEVAQESFGPVDLFCSNAGITTGTGLDTTDESWDRAWSVNVHAHVVAARAVLPSMLDRGAGYLLQTCSAAGLLTAVGDAPYAVTKHAAVAFAEWLSMTYGDRGIGVSALCPQGVRTPMLEAGLARGHAGAHVTALSGEVLTPEQVADAVVEGLAAERFLILPHPEVATYQQRKAENPDRWLASMRKLISRVGSTA